MSRAVLVALAACGACKKSESVAPTSTPAAPLAKKYTIGLVTDLAGRGDESFNDSALRGLEGWAGGVTFASGGYSPMSPEARLLTIPLDLRSKVPPLAVTPIVVQSKAQEDYQPNLQLLVDQGADLVIGTGFMLENSVEAIAKANPKALFLLIDSPILDAKGAVQSLPNVRTIVFREEEGSFLVGALAGLVAKEKVGFVGGMELPLTRKFEAGFRAGVKATHPNAAVMVQYTGSFDNVAAGKQVAQDLVNKGAEVIFHAAGSDGVGVIQAVKEARAAGKTVYAIGVDSDQSHLAPQAVLTSMIKRVDYAVFLTAKDLADAKFTANDVVMGLKEGGVTYAEVRIEFDGKAQAVAKVEALRAQIVSGALPVPSNLDELSAFQSP
jgi:basic membrane protein A